MHDRLILLKRYLESRYDPLARVYVVRVPR